MSGFSEEEVVANRLIEVIGGSFISRRDGMVLIKVPCKGKTVIIWIRKSPITSSALKLFDKMIMKHDYDELILLKIMRIADYVKFSELNRRFSKIFYSIDEMLNECK